MITNSTITGNKSKTGGGGIHANTIVKIVKTTIKNNERRNGGGVYIDAIGTFRMPSGVIESNTATKGEGVYQNGMFELSDAGYVNSNNTVYLPKGKNIKITGKLTVSNVLASYIDPESKNKGTILVDVVYSGGTAEKELYYEGDSRDEAQGRDVTKKFATVGGYMLRPTNNIPSFHSSRFIVISERYEVKYNGNSLDPVANLPQDGIAFWEENFKVSNNIVSRMGFVLNTNKLWNLSADGLGEVLKPGVDTVIDSDTTLYAIWEELVISSLTMFPVDRYYVVGQKITLTAQELTKKVKVENDLLIDVTYDIRVTKIVDADGNIVAQGHDLKTEDYINTNEDARYKLYLTASNSQGSVTCTGDMLVTILEDYYDKTEVRFISKEFIDTLDPRSKWKREKEDELNESLNNEDNYIYTVDLKKEDMDYIRNNLKNNRHKIDFLTIAQVSGKIIKR